nr:sulfhydryl oxidase 1-like [Biomphalaria glabrata]
MYQTVMICLLFIYASLLSPAYGLVDGLYSSEEDVVVLNNETFPSTILTTKPDNKVWAVQFYNSWCGHCKHFAPTWKAMATEFKDLNDIIGFAAIDCSQKSNLQICRQFDISMYPTLKIFPPIYNSTRSNSCVELHSQSPSLIMKKIFQVLADFPTQSWPNIKPLQKIEDIWLEKKDAHKHILLIFENEDSNLGPEVMLDVQKFQNVLLRRMLQNDVSKFGISKFPSLYQVNKDSTYTFLAVGDSNSEDTTDSRRFFVKVIHSLTGDLMNVPTVDVKKDSHILNGGITNEQKVQHKLNSTKVTMQDLESALHYSLRQEVAIMKTIEGERLTALREYIHILVKYFPGRKPVLGFLRHVYNMLSNLDKTSLTGEEWLEKIDQAQDADNYLPSVILWESCQGSSPHYRGYPCGMWTLFHVLTVESYLQHQRARPNDPGNPQEVLLAIKGYMKYFFGCHECSNNFLAMAETIPNEVTSWKEEVLWLWSAHNKANKRLHKDVSEDPEHPKIQFPPESLCPVCQKLSQSDQGVTLSWDAEKVLEFLLNFYSEQSIIFSIHLMSGDEDSISTVPSNQGELDWWEKKQKKEDLKQIWQIKEQRKLRKKESKRSVEDTYNSRVRYTGSPGFLSSWGLTQLDLSVCIIFYLFSTMIILFLYHHFIARRRLISCKPTKNSP